MKLKAAYALYLGSFFLFIKIILLLCKDLAPLLAFEDIDYGVFSDGSKYLLSHGTPYKRHTYRYSPVLAYLMIPNVKYY